jgi:hypothetical protein
MAGQVSFAPILLFLTAPAVAQPTSLLDALLEDAPALSVALTNVAQNLGMVDGSFAVSVERNFLELASGLDGLSAGTQLVAGVGVRVSEVQAGALAGFDALGLELRQVATTAVGSLQSADLTGSFDASGLTERIELSADAASLTLESRGGIAGLVAMQNMSLNAGEVTGAVELRLADVDARIEGLTTTAIGALQNGALRTTVDLSATVNGQMGEITAATTALVTAMVGS